MSLIIGFDAGGTFTDSVVFNTETKKIISSGKALTTNFALSQGIKKSLNVTLKDLPIRDKKNIKQIIVSSTTREVLSQLAQIEFDNLEKGVSKTIGLSKIDGISFAEQNVQLSFEVEKFTEKIVELTLQAINVPKGYKIKFYPPKVSLVTTVAFADYDKLNSSFFLANVDASQMAGKSKLKVSINQKPTFAELVKIKPSRVEFLLLPQ